MKKTSNKIGYKMISFIFFIFFLYSGCNLFSSLDKPQGETQIISAARACFDQGKFSCAAFYYNQLISKTDVTNDEAIIENLFETFSQNGLTAVIFINAVENTKGERGVFFNTLAAALFTKAGERTRLHFFTALCFFFFFVFFFFFLKKKKKHFKKFRVLPFKALVSF